MGVVAGGANNQLARDEHGEELRRRGILYAPDFVINAGGMMRVASEHGGFDQNLVDRQVAGIEGVLLRIFERSDAEGVSTNVAAMRIARDRLVKAGRLVAA